MDEQQAANTLADEWLTTMSRIGWEDSAASIRHRHPAPCGETTQGEQDGITFEVSDSWKWLGEEGGDIHLTVEVFRSNARLTVRTTIIAKS